MVNIAVLHQSVSESFVSLSLSLSLIANFNSLRGETIINAVNEKKSLEYTSISSSFAIKKEKNFRQVFLQSLMLFKKKFSEHFLITFLDLI